MLHGMGPGRQADFVAGRRAAARALDALGRAGPVLREGRRPLFPPGVRGSISHCVGHIGACVATTNPAVAAVGIDLERTDRLTWGTTHLICTPREARWAAAARRPESRLSVVFSAKEAVYKALSALSPHRRPLFHDSEIKISGKRLDIRVSGDLLPPGHDIFGWALLIPGGYVLTFTAVTIRRHTSIRSGHQPSFHFLAETQKAV
ncbi:4'-phosphopantetheinyl transferase superfamily protein [Streptomyces sp. DSM 40750]|uniref:4'-phosphopantetheinyl transferase superfamily protein n=1 Tax=Streptomyces sp. DSM 40750 TaxID=2801030 RepID=UPI00214C24E6|nr:4'-phosphopantetheinyl transferase superfamily protein [Streptomyces sp. DSM 40750]UUU28020.1 4'-phosphopantetheinyl transferase superfamily protein [Streptomyces sp. DSM 40750]